MNIKIERDVLLKPLSNVSGIVEKRHALPILSNLLIEGENNSLKFTATDLEVQISLNIQANISENFSTTVAARKLFDITRALPEQSIITVQIEENKVFVNAAKSKFNLQSLPPKDYPLMKKNEARRIRNKIITKSIKGPVKTGRICDGAARYPLLFKWASF
jgi:DNA polymerase-3 subunit beta